MYIGRFAPSPTGLLHIGSLLTAVASYLDAKAHGGKWFVRIEDLDPPRQIVGASDHILQTLDKFGLHWDDKVVYQSQRDEYYRHALAQLTQIGLVYPCYCSRKQWHTHAKMGSDGYVYNGHCRQQTLSLCDKIPAYRIVTPQQNITFCDRIVGQYTQNLAQDIGDFVLLRADGLWAYQLAVVVDDMLQGITHIVRGQDLLVSTPRQIYLQQCLQTHTPQYAHLPLLTNAQGQKWSKQTHAPTLDLNQCEALLRQVFTYLNLPSAPDIDTLTDLLTWGIIHWRINRIPQTAICTET